MCLCDPRTVISDSIWKFELSAPDGEKHYDSGRLLRDYVRRNEEITLRCR